MKVLFNHCRLINDDWGDTKLGIGWFKHHPDLKWKGFDLVFYLLFWRVNVTYVSNWKEYDKKINYRRDPDYLKKRAAKLAALRAEKK
jgi:hypothetical protein